MDTLSVNGVIKRRYPRGRCDFLELTTGDNVYVSGSGEVIEIIYSDHTSPVRDVRRGTPIAALEEIPGVVRSELDVLRRWYLPAGSGAYYRFAGWGPEPKVVEDIYLVHEDTSTVCGHLTPDVPSDVVAASDQPSTAPAESETTKRITYRAWGDTGDRANASIYVCWPVNGMRSACDSRNQSLPHEASKRVARSLMWHEVSITVTTERQSLDGLLHNFTPVGCSIRVNGALRIQRTARGSVECGWNYGY